MIRPENGDRPRPVFGTMLKDIIIVEIFKVYM